MPLLTMEYVKKELYVIRPTFEISNDEYYGIDSELNVECTVCGSKWVSTRRKLKKSKCPYCTRSILTDKNRVSTVRPDLIKYFINKNDTSLYSIGSNKKALLKCPDCGHEKEMIINMLNKRGFSCNRCSDGISLPNKFMFNVLLQTGLDFESEKTFEWSDKKRYDFYLPSLDILIEVNGEQHYKHTGFYKSLKEEQKNDELKLSLAMAHNIKVVVINASTGNLDDLKKQVEVYLSEYLNLQCINWNTVNSYCSTSLMKSCWSMYNSGMKIIDICNNMKLVRGTVRRYLRVGSEIGSINYTPNISSGKEVSQYSENGDLIKTYKNITLASNENCIKDANICNVCSGKRKSAGGFLWKYTNLLRGGV